MYDDCGKLTFTQLIFRDRDEAILAWRMDKGIEITRDHRRGGVSVIWLDNGKLRVIRAKSAFELHTQWDREIFEREELPQDKRRGLRP